MSNGKFISLQGLMCDLSIVGCLTPLSVVFVTKQTYVLLIEFKHICIQLEYKLTGSGPGKLPS